MKRILVVTPHDARYGFRLAGVTHITCEPLELKQILDTATADASNGFIIIDERLMSGDTEELITAYELVWEGVIAVLPPPERGEEVTEDYVSRLIRRAIGYHVRITP